MWPTVQSFVLLPLRPLPPCQYHWVPPVSLLLKYMMGRLVDLFQFGQVPPPSPPLNESFRQQPSHQLRVKRTYLPSFSGRVLFWGRGRGGGSVPPLGGGCHSISPHHLLWGQAQVGWQVMYCGLLGEHMEKALCSPASPLASLGSLFQGHLHAGAWGPGFHVGVGGGCTSPPLLMARPASPISRLDRRHHLPPPPSSFPPVMALLDHSCMARSPPAG